MIIYQIHEVHGKHMANTSVEALANEANGWKTVTEEEFYADTKPKEKPDETEKADETEPETAGEEVLESIEIDVPDITDDDVTELTDADEREVLEQFYQEKFGEKPHHRMKNETIKAKLEEE